MSVRRSRRTAAAAAETRIARAVEADSEDSNGSNYAGNSNNSSDPEDTASSGNASDADFEISSSGPRQYGGKKKSNHPSPQKRPTPSLVPIAPAATAPVPVQQLSAATTPAAEATTSTTSTTSSSTNANSAYKELSDDSLKSMIRSFRLTDLQALMIFVGKNKAGRKTELMERSIELVDSTSGDIKKRLGEKIQELSSAFYRSMSSAPSVNPYSANYRPSENSGAYNPNSIAAAPIVAINTTQEAGYVPLHLSTTGSNLNGMQAASNIPRGYEPNYGGQHQNTTGSYPYYNNANSHFMYPTFPDVKLRSLPFYKIESVLMRPSSLQPRGLARFQEQTFSFHLTPTQASAVAQSSYRDTIGRQDFKKQIQLRFSLLETSCEQDDNFPSSVCVKVNGRLQPLPNPIPTNKPGVEPRRPPKPINITGLCKLSSTVPNYLNVSWAVEVGSGYTVSVYFVDKLSSSDLMDELKRKGKRHSDYTRAVIKDKLSDNDSEIATTSCKVSLACPLGKMRMSTPCRASTCDHLQCFDANLYLMMNEKKPKWMCPVCNKAALYENLLIDGYFSDVLNSKRLPTDEHEIVLQNDASWDPQVPAKKPHDGDKKPKMEPLSPPSPVQETSKKVVPTVETLDLDDDSDDSPTPTPALKVPQKKSIEVDYVTLDSDTDDEEPDIAPPASKRPRMNAFLDDLDDNSDSVSALTPNSVSPPPKASTSSTKNNPMLVNNPPESPPLICLDDD